MEGLKLESTSYEASSAPSNYAPNLDKSIPISHAITPWLLEHTCVILNVKVKGTNGVTASARARGRAFNQRLLAILEKVLYKLPLICILSARHGNMRAPLADIIF